MLHHIIVKFNETVTDRNAIIEQARELFNGLTSIPGIHGVELYPSCIDRANRYDLMIAIDMDREALPVYDECQIHKTWKSEFGKYILSKAIFDREN